MTGRITVAIGSLALGLLTGCDRFGEGSQAYERGQFAAALAAFAAAENAAGDTASVELLRNRALAALRAGQLRDAEFSAEKVVVRGGSEFVAFREFVFGSTAFARCQRAEVEAGLEDPDPTAFDRAIGHAELARDAWRRAAEGRGDWPAARRNDERATRKLADLRARKEREDRARRSRPEVPFPREPESEPDPVAEGVQPGEEEGRAPVPQTDPDALTARELERVLARLLEKEREKLELRRALREADGTRVERDW